jgi:hypothetical protein
MHVLWSNGYFVWLYITINLGHAPSFVNHAEIQFISCLSYLLLVISLESWQLICCMVVFFRSWLFGRRPVCCVFVFDLLRVLIPFPYS